jgi:hypothetical protein
MLVDASGFHEERLARRGGAFTNRRPWGTGRTVWQSIGGLAA